MRLTRRPILRCLSRVRLEPVDDLGGGDLPNTPTGVDVAQHFVEMPDAPRLAYDPRVQMQYHQPPGGGAVGIKPIEPLAPQQVDFVDRAPAVQVDVIVVSVCIHPERVEFPGTRSHL